VKRTYRGRDTYLGEFEEVVLLAVARLGDGAYGMSVRREIEARTGRTVAIGAVYPTLQRLTDKDLLRAVARDPHPDRDGRARYFFELTAAGAAALAGAERMRAQLREGVGPARYQPR
jgi:DNA-binding PadR family transcriptional regulator